ncbi:hypothetical protein VAWG004_08860 [Aeromonas veronii]|nr:hypothetical protein VAWG004_08860 [Aeromonas veronii]
MMGFIVTSPLIPGTSPLVCDQDWERGADMLRWLCVGSVVWVNMSSVKLAQAIPSPSGEG